MSIYRANVITIAGTDSGGGAGVQADLKTFAALKVFGMTAVTAITAQNSLGVSAIHDIPPQIVTAQLDAVFSDFTVDAVKTGMFSRADTVLAVSQSLRKYGAKNIVTDPVMIAQSGSSLVSDGAVQTLISELIPMAALVTPNIPEAEVLSGIKIKSLDDMRRAAVKILSLGAGAVLLKGGHLEGDEIFDVLASPDGERIFKSNAVKTTNTHGTGCTLSSAIAAELGSGESLDVAVERGRKYVYSGILNSFKPGKGCGPLGHAIEMEWVKK